MPDSKEMLASIIKTTFTEQADLRYLLKLTLCVNLKKSLLLLIREYSAIEREALLIASSRGWQTELPDIRMSSLFIRTKLIFGCSNSRAAAMVIRRISKHLHSREKDLRRFHNSDKRICILLQKLHDCEKANIQQMRGFL